MDQQYSPENRFSELPTPSTLVADSPVAGVSNTRHILWKYDGACPYQEEKFDILLFAQILHNKNS